MQIRERPLHFGVQLQAQGTTWADYARGVQAVEDLGFGSVWTFDHLLPFVGPDNRAGARKVGEALAKQLKPGDKVAIIEGIPTAFNGQHRRLGFEDAMKAASVEIVSVQSGRWEMETANNIAAAMLNEHANLKAILCANDNMALGAVSAIQAAGKTGKVLVVGFDNISALRPLLGKGQVVATADQHGDQLAVYGIEVALKILKGEAPPADQTTAVDLVTK